MDVCVRNGRRIAGLVFGVTALGLGGCVADLWEPEPVLGPGKAMAAPEMAIARSSMASLDARMEMECHNLANTDTPGYKAMVAMQESVPFRVGESGGARIGRTMLDMMPGCPTKGGMLDIYINGNGLFRVEMGGEGGFAYTRDGRFVLNADRELTTIVGGHPVSPRIVVPSDAADISVTESGGVFVDRHGANEPDAIGQLEIAMFGAPEFLMPVGGTLYAETATSGAVMIVEPGTRESGTLVQGEYEASNVDPHTVGFNIMRIRRERACWMDERSAAGAAFAK